MTNFVVSFASKANGYYVSFAISFPCFLFCSDSRVCFFRGSCNPLPPYLRPAFMCHRVDESRDTVVTHLFASPLPRRVNSRASWGGQRSPRLGIPSNSRVTSPIRQDVWRGRKCHEEYAELFRKYVGNCMRYVVAIKNLCNGNLSRFCFRGKM